MRTEKIIKRDDGKKIRIITDLSNYNGNVEFKNIVHICMPKKRTWYGVYSTNDHDYRKLSFEEREAFTLNSALNHVTKEELLQAKLELWESIKPKL